MIYEVVHCKHHPQLRRWKWTWRVPCFWLSQPNQRWDFYISSCISRIPWDWAGLWKRKREKREERIPKKKRTNVTAVERSCTSIQLIWHARHSGETPSADQHTNRKSPIRRSLNSQIGRHHLCVVQCVDQEIQRWCMGAWERKITHSLSAPPPSQPLVQIETYTLAQNFRHHGSGSRSWRVARTWIEDMEPGNLLSTLILSILPWVSYPLISGVCFIYICKLYIFNVLQIFKTVLTTCQLCAQWHTGEAYKLRWGFFQPHPCTPMSLLSSLEPCIAKSTRLPHKPTTM